MNNDAVSILIPMLSARCHLTGKYDFLLDGNIQCHLSTVAQYSKKPVWLLLPKHLNPEFGVQTNAINPESYIRFVKHIEKYYPNVRILQVLTCFSNAAGNREKYIPENQQKIIEIIKKIAGINTPTQIITDYPNFGPISNILLEDEQIPLKPEIIYMFNTYLDFKSIDFGKIRYKLTSIDQGIYSKIGEIWQNDRNNAYYYMFDSENTLNRMQNVNVQKEVAKEAPTLIETLIKEHDENLKYKMATHKELEFLKNPKRYLFFPMRASDPCYNLLKVVELAVATGMPLAVIDPNGSFESELNMVERETHLRKIPSDLVAKLRWFRVNAVSAHKCLYYHLLISGANIPYYENPYKLLHPGYVEMKELGANLIGV